MVQHLSRRVFLRTAVLGGSGLFLAYLLGCQEEEAPRPASPAAGSSPAAPGATATPTAAAESSVLRWQPLQPVNAAPAARRDHAFVTDGNLLYVFGGRSQGVPRRDFWVYDPARSQWTELPVPPAVAPRFGHNAAYDAPRKRLVVFGGQGEGSTFFGDAWAVDLSSGEWSELAPPPPGPAPRYGAGSALDPAGRLLISHGFTDQGRFDDTWGLALDSSSWADLSPQAPRPVERCLMRAAWDPAAARLLMFGGQTTGTPFLGDLWALEDGAPDGPSGWREISADPRPSPRNFYAMAYDGEGHRLILFGGNTQDGPVNDLWFFDGATESWSQPSPQGEAPPAHAGHDAVWLADSRRLIVFGGEVAGADSNDLMELSVPL